MDGANGRSQDSNKGIAMGTTTQKGNEVADENGEDIAATPLEEEGYEWTGNQWVRQDYSNCEPMESEGHVDKETPEDSVVKDSVVEDSVVEDSVMTEETRDQPLAIAESGEYNKPDEVSTMLNEAVPAVPDEAASTEPDQPVLDATCEGEGAILATGDEDEELDKPIETQHIEVVIDPLEDSGSVSEADTHICGFSDDDEEKERVANKRLEVVSLLDPDYSICALSLLIPALKSSELKKELKARGLPTSGIKEQLQNRLQKAMESPGELNEDAMRVQAGEFDSDHEESSEDIGVIMARRMKKIKPEVEERRRKVWELLEADMSVKDISDKLGLHITTVQKIQKMKTGGTSAKFKFMRMQISNLLDDNQSTKDICRIVKCSPRLVFKVAHMKKSGISLDLQHKGGERKIRTEEFLENIWSLRCADPSMKMRKMAKIIGVSAETIRLAIREDLCLFSYKFRKTQLIPKKKRPVRVRRGKMILEWREKNPNTVIIWTDEKSWDVDSTTNHQNDRYLAFSVQEVPEKHRTQKPVGAMMLGVIASDGKKMPPLWIDRNAKVDSAVYIELLKKVKEWLDETYGDHTPWVFMQDGAPSHTSEATQTWLKKNFGEHRFWPESMWPPYSCDLNPLDYNIWGYTEAKACANAHPSVSALQKSVDKYWMELLTEDHIKKTCDSAWNRIKRMIQAKGNTFESRIPKTKKGSGRKTSWKWATKNATTEEASSERVVSSCSGPPHQSAVHAPSTTDQSSHPPSQTAPDTASHPDKSSASTT